jgi:hypothetical protein
VIGGAVRAAVTFARHSFRWVAGAAVHSRLVLGLVLGPVILIWSVGYVEPAAALRWSAQEIQVPNAPVASKFVAVSCASRVSCMAVGSLTLSDGSSDPLVGRWDGRKWSVEPILMRTRGQLLAVSCTSARACTAVGSYAAGEALVVRWNGNKWSTQAAGRPSGGLTDVSYSSANSCVAVSDSAIRRWNGRRWSDKDFYELLSFLPGPDTALQDVSVRAMSCASTTACMVFGVADYSCYPPTCSDETDLPETFLVRWDGKAWSVQLSAPSLAAVSCASARVCVGLNGPSLLRWNGSKWSRRRLPKPRGSKNIRLVDISCPSRSRCTIMGSYTARGGRRTAFSERLAGSQWSIQQVPAPPGQRGILLGGISCPPRGPCAIVGHYTNRAGRRATLAEVWQRSRWSPRTPPEVTFALPTALKGLSCPVATFCAAVGSYEVERDSAIPLVDVWDGTRWTHAAQPFPAWPQTAS